MCAPYCVNVCVDCRIVLKVTADPDQLRFAANVLMENGDGLSSGVSSAAIGEHIKIVAMNMVLPLKHKRVYITHSMLQATVG